MGALHAGHLELVRRARDENPAVAASIFVNPTQFTSPTDFQHYPRDLDRDLRLLEAAGVELAFVPSADTIYPNGFATSIDPGPIAVQFEGEARPGHFQGVATVVTILLNIVQPSRAYFGQKDVQQVLVVRRLIADLQLPVEIIAVPTVRDTDGLALSSRNVLLKPEDRIAARCIPHALQAVCKEWDGGERNPLALERRLRDELLAESGVTIGYARLVEPDSLSTFPGNIAGSALVLVAVQLGGIRLIDNCFLPDSRASDVAPG
jgi:pantoate--beta-alanine ligase